MQMTNPLTKARGYGGTGEGSLVWFWQRITAISLIFLLPWFIVSIVLFGSSYDSVVSWLSNTINCSLLIMLILSGFYHGLLGVRTVIEDYVHCNILKFFSIVSLYLFVIGCIVLSITAILIV